MGTGWHALLCNTWNKIKSWSNMGAKVVTTFPKLCRLRALWYFAKCRWQLYYPGRDKGPSFYHPESNPLGQIFNIGEIVALAGGNYSSLAINGGVIGIRSASASLALTLCTTGYTFCTAARKVCHWCCNAVKCLPQFCNFMIQDCQGRTLNVLLWLVAEFSTAI